MPRKRQAKEITVERELRAWTLRQQGYTQTQIASIIGVDQGTVSRILDRIYARETAKLGDLVQAQRVVQIYQLEHMYSEVQRAWERSKGERHRGVLKRETAGQPGAGPQDGDPAGELVETTEVVTRDGDPRFQAEARAILADLRTLTGLNIQPAENDGVTSIAKLMTLKAKAEDYEREHPPEEGDAGDTGEAG
jgi:hypothetical protein